MSLSRRAIRVVALAASCVVYSCGGDTPTAIATPAAVATVEIVPARPAVVVGTSLQLTTILKDQAGIALSGRVVAWSTSAPAVVVVDAVNGLARGMAAGSATITATAEGKSGATSFTVIAFVAARVATVFIDSIVPRLYVGRTAQLTAVVRDSAGALVTNRALAWTSSAPSFVTVSGTGLLAGVAPGSATITATLDGVSGARVVVAQAIPSALIALQPAFGSLARGVDYALATAITDIDGKPLAGHSVTYATSDPTVATVSATGVVHPLANGFVTITGTVDGALQADARLSVMDPRTVAGQVITADGGSPSNLVFVALTGIGPTAQRFLTTIDGATGMFSLQMPNAPASQFIEYYVDVTAGATRSYHPSYVKLPASSVPNTARILLIPHAVVPDSGTYAGTRFVLDLNEAFTPVCTTPTDQNCQSYWPSYFLNGIKMWADAARPVPLAIDRTTGNPTAADSTAMWATIRAMEADLGRALYTPAAFTGYTSPGYTTGMVLASLDPTVAPFTGYTNWSWDAQGALYQAKVRLASSQIFANESMVTHELNHALGFHHTCRWATVMGGYGCPQQGRLTANDVAYYHLADIVRKRAAAVNPTWSIAESLQGVRVIELGIASSNAMPAALAAVRSRIGLPGEDGSP